MTFVAGQKLKASDLNDAIGYGIIARQQRTTDITTTGAITRVMGTIATVTSGRTYAVRAQAEMYKSAATATDVVSQSELRYTTDGTEPTVTSTVLDRAIIHHQITGTPEMLNFTGLFHCTSSGTFRVVLTMIRAVGTGNITLSGGAAFPAVLVIQDVGLTVAVSGTVY